MPTPIPVLFAHNSPAVAGANRVLLGVMDGMDRREFAPLSLLPDRGPMEVELRSRNVPVVVRDIIRGGTEGGRLTQAATVAFLSAWSWVHRFSILHAQSPLSYRLPSRIVAGRRIRKVCHLHYPDEDAEAGLRWAFQRPPDLVIACSESIRRHFAPAMERCCPDVPLEVLANFADTEGYRPGAPPAALLDELGSRGASHVVTIVGQIGQRKGHPDFLKAVSGLRTEYPRALFLIAGDDIAQGGRYRKAMEQLAEDLKVAPAVRFLGFREDIRDVLLASDIVVLPSYAEGMPLSLIEAAACGKPTVAYDIPGVDEVIVNGETGRLVPVGDVDSLRLALSALMKDDPLRKAMGRAARKRAEDEFSLTRYTARLQAMYHGLLGT